MSKRDTGAIVADRAGVSTPYALHHLQPRGNFFVSPGVDVYEGMIVGEHNRPNDTDVNVIKEKKLSNVRNHGKDENVMLAPPRVLTIETAMEWIDADELVEVTPEAIRVRKQILADQPAPAAQRGDRGRAERVGAGGGRRTGSTTPAGGVLGPASVSER